MSVLAARTINFRATDATGHKTVEVGSAPAQSSVNELVAKLLDRMGMVRKDAQGKTISYRARLEREGRHLHGSEKVGDALESGDQLTLLPEINAG